MPKSEEDPVKHVADPCVICSSCMKGRFNRSYFKQAIGGDRFALCENCGRPLHMASPLIARFTPQEQLETLDVTEVTEQ